RLDERAPDVVVADEAHLVRQPGLLGVADRRRYPRVRHRDDDVRGHGRLARELTAELLPYLVDVAAEDAAVGTGEVDVLEDAVVALGAREGPHRLDAPRAHDHDLPRLDL